MKALLLLLPLALGACSAFHDRMKPLPPPASQAEADCRKTAYDDPTVKQFIIANQTLQSADHEGQERAYRKAILRCMQAKGLAPLGGVEPIERQ